VNCFFAFLLSLLLLANVFWATFNLLVLLSDPRFGQAWRAWRAAPTQLKEKTSD
jgi:hypothetical protein